MTEAELRERVKEFSHLAPRGPLRVFEDASEFMSIQPGDILELEGASYLVRGDEVEGRCGLEGEPKFWVKRAVDLQTGQLKIIKLVFHESFPVTVAGEQILCFRSPQKEARVLELTQGDPFFMQGRAVTDQAGNAIRVIDKIQGSSLFELLRELELDHRSYFFSQFPELLEKVIGCTEAIGRLHSKGGLHGDIRNDHIFVERDSGQWSWIDFDFAYDNTENPFGVDLLGLGNVLLFTVGKGFHHPGGPAGRREGNARPASELKAEDMSLAMANRIVNLKKVFPYIPAALNDTLMFFSQAAEAFYESVEELVQQLQACREELTS
ncbi:MAG: serine/threonine protein kinase [bacterium]